MLGVGGAWTFIVGYMQINLWNAGTLVCKHFPALLAFFFLLVVSEVFQIFLSYCTLFFSFAFPLSKIFGLSRLSVEEWGWKENLRGVCDPGFEV